VIKLSSNYKRYVTYHDIKGLDGHFLEIDFPNPSDVDEIKLILTTASKDLNHHSSFFNRSGAYVYYLEHKEEQKVYVGQASQLESRALNKNRLSNEKVRKVLLFSNTRADQFDESEIQHLEYTILRELNNSDAIVKNVQSVSGSITTEARRNAVRDWFDVVKKKMVGKFDGFTNRTKPVGKMVKIRLTRDNSTHFCYAEAEFFYETGRVWIPKGTVASHRRWQVPLTYQKVKTGMINANELIETKPHGKFAHSGYEFAEDRVLMNISEATTIILNAPQGSNAWKIGDTNEFLQNNKDYWKQ
jgi:hypothetical protein